MPSRQMGQSVFGGAVVSPWLRKSVWLERKSAAREELLATLEKRERRDIPRWEGCVSRL